MIGHCGGGISAGSGGVADDILRRQRAACYPVIIETTDRIEGLCIQRAAKAGELVFTGKITGAGVAELTKTDPHLLQPLTDLRVNPDILIPKINDGILMFKFTPGGAQTLHDAGKIFRCGIKTVAQGECFKLGPARAAEIRRLQFAQGAHVVD